MKDRIKGIVRPVFKVFNGVNKLLFKKKNKIVIYSNRGFRDNVKVLYDYLIEKKYNENYTIICSINDYKKYKKLQIDNVVFTNNYWGIYHFLTSKYFFYTHGKYPIKPSAKQVVINLWHGTPLKTIGNLEKGKEHIDYNFFSFILATSDVFSEIMKKAFSCKEEQIKICGHPRNDLLFKPIKNPIDEEKKLVLWLPTHRNYDGIDGISKKLTGSIPIFTDHEKMKELDEYLHELNTNLIIKIHPTQNYDGSEYQEYENVEVWTEEDLNIKDINLYQLLGRSEALITDYSSVYFDFLLLDRPIAFTVNDLEMYKGERGFVFDDPEDYMPGPKVENKIQFFDFLYEISGDKDVFKGERDRVNKLANYYTDGDNCRRVLDIAGIKQ